MNCRNCGSEDSNLKPWGWCEKCDNKEKARIERSNGKIKEPQSDAAFWREECERLKEALISLKDGMKSRCMCYEETSKHAHRNPCDTCRQTRSAGCAIAAHKDRVEKRGAR